MTDIHNTVTCHRSGGIAHIRFNRPGVLNALDPDMAGTFLSLCQNLATDVTLRVVVVSGAGRAFMAGGDIAVLQGTPQHVCTGMIEPMHEALQCLAALSVPVIASLHGPVAGAGMSLALACDLAIAAEDTRFHFSYIDLGLTCDLGGSWSLPRVVGMRRALQIAMLGEPVDANAALQMGLVNFVTPIVSLAQTTSALAHKLAAKSAPALGMLKALIRASFENTLKSQLQAEQEGLLKCLATDEFSTAVNAYQTKRRARALAMPRVPHSV